MCDDNLTPEQREERERRSEARHDLVKRFVAVAISVGFASVLTRMTWLAEGSWPSLMECEQLLRLFTALTVILLGWEWHHKDLAIHEHTSDKRFLIDILVVIFSLIFLISDAHERLWLLSLVGIFASYILWDVVTFGESEEARGREGAWVAPATNAVWLLYYLGILGLVFLPFWNTTLIHTALLCAAIVLGAMFLTSQGKYQITGLSRKGLRRRSLYFYY